ncbi:nascent polypeptide-associated complex subunit alpha, muscle-specific form-like isoform X2 [Bombina bombina]|uniref:nascent polypeptide-associated complex subunit alpha, muscle-specific form-like isoform X2 n=1 Tax=Bombina bombina TaxID=8345 RepID=UPI00235AA81E|nr:nascent polypeptide-associated complex subunit alpha, muscle-specific form-like isoform X2 [Bombina bombina]
MVRRSRRQIPPRRLQDSVINIQLPRRKKTETVKQKTSAEKSPSPPLPGSAASSPCPSQSSRSSAGMPVFSPCSSPALFSSPSGTPSPVGPANRRRQSPAPHRGPPHTDMLQGSYPDPPGLHRAPSNYLATVFPSDPLGLCQHAAPPAPSCPAISCPPASLHLSFPACRSAPDPRTHPPTSLQAQAALEAPGILKAFEAFRPDAKATTPRLENNRKRTRASLPVPASAADGGSSRRGAEDSVDTSVPPPRKRAVLETEGPDRGPSSGKRHRKRARPALPVTRAKQPTSVPSSGHCSPPLVNKIKAHSVKHNNRGQGHRHSSPPCTLPNKLLECSDKPRGPSHRPSSHIEGEKTRQHHYPYKSRDQGLLPYSMEALAPHMPPRPTLHHMHGLSSASGNRAGEYSHHSRPSTRQYNQQMVDYNAIGATSPFQHAGAYYHTPRRSPLPQGAPIPPPYPTPRAFPPLPACPPPPSAAQHFGSQHRKWFAPKVAQVQFGTAQEDHEQQHTEGGTQETVRRDQTEVTKGLIIQA